MIHAVRVHETGGPEVLRFEKISLPAPGPGEVQIRHEAIGLNFIDVYHRTGLYPVDHSPFIPGMEGAGVVIALGEGVTEWQVGDRVAYAGVLGAYAEARNIPADRLVKLPQDISFETAAAMMLQGMTARFLLRATYQVGPQTTLLFHAAAGGVGLMACQWAAHLGATVIGTVGSTEKVSLAKANGCTHVIDTSQEDFVARVREITQGAGVDVVYDGVGRATFPASLDCLKRRGLWVSFGQASGALPEFNLAILAQKGSLFATRPTLFDYIATRSELVETAQDLFQVVGEGHVRVHVNQRYDLKDVAQAHRDLEARRTTGSTILIP